ncbi:probable inactive poly [ADP-ribose] polymerase SRO3 [Herrania umbratica]|uniref:Probable inactive poly [ADP-ribose] polymerase SRO3 n=1 Tax=Herrania umbratica TaxID=108875 RepID=A0A6J1ABK3_9ROSI|nr:probable inactive poly [ADP-ribose] polymerase SRO3 [Herrania umbratica]
MSQPAATTKNLVESVGDMVAPPPPPPSSSWKSSRKCACRRSSKRIASQNRANFEKSAAPFLFMYYRNSSWLNFSEDVVKTLRAGFLERRPIIEASIDGAKYYFDLKRMVQIDYVTGNQRSISWIDENHKCFFPNIFFSEEEITESESESVSGDNIGCNYKANSNNCNAKIEIEVKIDGASSKRKREEPEVSSANKAVDVIKRQRLEDGGAARWPDSLLLRETEKAYVVVKGHFLNGMKKADDGVTVTSIHQCKHEGHLNKARRKVFEKQVGITKSARGTSNIVYAWYGASAYVVESVLAHGFGMPSIVPAADVCGVGMYLSSFQLPQLSAKLADADGNDVKHLILCRLILGNVEKLEAGSKQCHPSSVDFDTGSDDPENPKWYVVWSAKANMHIMPECVVSFRASGNIQGQPRPAAGVGYSLERLFSKIKSCLPPAKVREIWISYSTFKAGKLARDAFLRHLRLVAGDGVLKSAILEISASR